LPGTKSPAEAEQQIKVTKIDDLKGQRTPAADLPRGVRSVRRVTDL